MFAHNHNFTYAGSNYSAFLPSQVNGGSLAFYIGANQGYSLVGIASRGGSQAFNQLQPYLALNAALRI